MARQPSSTLFAGADDAKQVGDWAWVRARSTGNWTIDLFCFVLRKVFRRTLQQASFDQQSFEQALAAVPSGAARVIVPMHRSYYDFLFCSFLFHTQPDLGFKLPQIAAAEEFGNIPVLGRLLNKAGAFYIRRNLGREDQRLTEQVQALVRQQDTLEFFIEGQRSRNRHFLAPKRGLLRALQGTGETFALLPISISYDRLADERAYEHELCGEAKQPMDLTKLFRWVKRMRRGEVKLGRAHLTCSAPILLAADSDVKAVAYDVIRQMQRANPVSEYHLDFFLQQDFAANGAASGTTNGITVEQIRRALEQRGATVIASPLKAGKACAAAPPTAAIARSFSREWLHWVIDDALQCWPDNPALQDYAGRHQHIAPVPAELREQAVLPVEFLQAAFAPLCADYSAVVEQLLATCQTTASAAATAETKLQESGLLKAAMSADATVDYCNMQDAIEALLAASALEKTAAASPQDESSDSMQLSWNEPQLRRWQQSLQLAAAD